MIYHHGAKSIMHCLSLLVLNPLDVNIIYHQIANEKGLFKDSAPQFIMLSILFLIYFFLLKDFVPSIFKYKKKKRIIETHLGQPYFHNLRFNLQAIIEIWSFVLIFCIFLMILRIAICNTPLFPFWMNSRNWIYLICDYCVLFALFFSAAIIRLLVIYGVEYDFEEKIIQW